jgi:hypothetical protein
MRDGITFDIVFIIDFISEYFFILRAVKCEHMIEVKYESMYLI